MLDARTKTARGRGAVGKRPVCYRAAEEIMSWKPHKHWKVLDYGCGTGHQVNQLMKTMLEQYDITMRTTYYDLNMGITLARGRQYDIIICSNVLNVQRSFVELDDTLAELAQILQEQEGECFVLANYPSQPRKLGINFATMKERIMAHDMAIRQIKVGSQPVLILTSE